MAFQPGKSGNPGGMTREEYAEREQVKSILLCKDRDLRWLASYDKALEDGLTPIILDYAYRRLGKPPEVLNVHNSDPLAAALLEVPPEKRLELIDALAKKVET